MLNPLLGSNYKHDPISGEFVDSKHMRMHEVIRDYNPSLRLVWIPKKDRGAEDVTPYAIADRNDDIIMWFTEAEMARPDKVLARLFRSDQEKHPGSRILTLIENEEAAAELLKYREFEDRKAEQREMALTILNSPLNKYTVKHRDGRKVTYRS